MTDKLQIRRMYARFIHIPLVPWRKQNEEARAIRHGHVVVASDPVPDIDKAVYAHASGSFIVRQGHRADAIPIVECMAYLARMLLRSYRS